MTSKLSLHIRVLGIGSFVLVMLFASAFYYYNRLEEDYLDERRQTKCRYLLNIIGRLMGDAMLRHNVIGLRDELRRMLSDDAELASLKLKFSAPGMPDIYVVSRNTALSPLRYYEEQRRVLAMDQGTFLARMSPVRSTEELGSLSIGFWQRSFMQGSNEVSILNVIIIADLLVLFGLFLHLLLRELVTRPLENFVDATRRIAAGDLSLSFEVPGASREEERLAGSFAEMITRLRESRQEISRANADLEQHVADRTEELRREKMASEAVIATIADGVYTVDSERRIRTFNAAAEKLTGHKAADVIGRPCYEVLEYPFCETHCILKRLHASPGHREADAQQLGEEYLEEFNAEGRTWLVAGSLFSDGPEFAGGVETIKDLSYTRAMQRKLRQIDKLTSLGILSAGVAHEINNPLSNIKIYGQLLQEDLAQSLGDGPAREAVKHILEQTDRANMIVRKMLEFSRQSAPELEAVDLGEIISQSLDMVRHILGSTGIEVAVELQPGLPKISGNRIALQQVFVNLFNNAWQAMKLGGTLTVKAFSERRGDLVVATVSDSGHGIKESDLGRIFDPFFTTKDVGEGTGLGLSISYGIIKDHRGDVSVESVEGKGTTFRISLPGVDARPAAN